jgi:ribonucleoside-diphosphate reductase beta chain
MFFGEPVKIARYDQPDYPIFEKLTKQQIGYGWVPEEVDVNRDRSDFRNLPEADQHIFTSNLKRQIVLDTKQGTAPSVAFLPIVSSSELETWVTTWSYFETIHSRSYTHIIRNIYANPGEVFDTILDIEPIALLADDIAKHYDLLIRHNSNLLLHRKEVEDSHKKALWMCLNSVNVLEGIRFYVSFACSWAFAERKQMEGNAKIIKLICRDENLHLAGTQHILKQLQKDDPYFAELAKSGVDEVVHMFEQAVNQEKAWAEYLFQHGSMIGLNYDMLVQYVEWIAAKRMHTLGLPNHFKGGSNPLPWTQKWISGAEVQVAPQETEISSYIVGGVKKDVNSDTFKGIML